MSKLLVLMLVEAHLCADLPLRMVISDFVNKPGLAGKVGVAGKIDCGALAPGTAVYVLPAGVHATVKALEAQGESAPVATAGMAVEVGLTGAQPEDVNIGSCLCHPDYPVHCTRRLRVCNSLSCASLTNTYAHAIVLSQLQKYMNTSIQ